MGNTAAIDPDYRISQLARMFGLSRSTLLYYDRIGLLRPSGRSRTNYRVYSNADRQRLEQICRYRRTGMSLETIAAVLAAPRKKTVKALEAPGKKPNLPGAHRSGYGELDARPLCSPGHCHTVQKASITCSSALSSNISPNLSRRWPDSGGCLNPGGPLPSSKETTVPISATPKAMQRIRPSGAWFGSRPRPAAMP